MPWQPIATIPKDGTHILIWCAVEQVVTSVRWSERDQAWYGTDPMDRLNWIQHPAHWMPMPAPPITAPP